MLLSMTGYGDARFQSDELTLVIELRALNNRHLKVSVRGPEPYNLLESEFEKLIRRRVRRCTVQVQVRCERKYDPRDYRINPTAFRSYFSQLRSLVEELGFRDRIENVISPVLALPGVVPEPGDATSQQSKDWPIVQRVLEEALGKLQQMRQEEGRAMSEEFRRLRSQIAEHLGHIRERAPHVAATYRDRLHDRVRTLLGELDVEIDRSDLIKEVSIFAERSDVAEEVTRLASHLDQFEDMLGEAESPGRKLEFLTQEMSRETNTIGSKAGDVGISRHVVEIKGMLEKIRELVQNVE